MPYQLACPCGQPLSIPDDYLEIQVSCPRCQTLLVPKTAETKSGNRLLPFQLVPAGPEVEIVDDDSPQAIRKNKKKVRKAKTRRKGLNKTGLGLAVHYASVGFFFFCIWPGLVGAILTIIYRSAGEPEKLGDAANFFTVTSGVFAILTCMSDIVACVLCLFIGHPPARHVGFVLLILWPITLILSICTFVAADFRFLFFGFAWALMFASWVVWNYYHRQVAHYIDQEQIGREAERIWLQGLFTTLGTLFLLGLILGMILVVVNVKFFLTKMVLISFFLSGVMGFIKIMATTKQIPFFELFLAPTGVPIGVRYFNLVGSLRMMIYRRA